MSSPRAAIYIAWLCSLLAANSGSAQDAATDLTLRVGEQRVLSSAGVNSYSEGARGIVDVRLTKDGSSFVIVGVHEGSSSLLVLMDDGSERNYHLHVLATAPADGEAAAAPTARDHIVARDNVRLDFYFVQLTKEYSHQLGIGYPRSLGGGTASLSFDALTGSFTDATAVVADQALPRLDMAQQSGWAKLLRQAAVITQNGSQASFAGGGELNVPIAGGLAANLRQIQFGSQIEVLPRYDRETGRIELELHADISDLASDGGTGVPGRVTSTLSSVVNLELGQSVVLAGLMARSESATHAGLPWLSQLPIIGGLFGSHASKREDLENVIVIVPSVIDAISLPAREQLRRAFLAYREYSGDLNAAQLTRPFLRDPGAAPVSNNPSQPTAAGAP